MNIAFENMRIKCMMYTHMRRRLKSEPSFVCAMPIAFSTSTKTHRILETMVLIYVTDKCLGTKEDLIYCDYLETLLNEFNVLL